MNLRIPGPTPLPPEVVKAMQRPMINHRGAEFVALQKKIIAGLQQVFQTSNDLFILPASGTGGLEAALVNVISPGNRVLAAIAGAFGLRFAEIAEAFGARVERLIFTEGTAIDPERVAASLRAAPDTRVVLLTHNETSTGVINPVETLARVVHENSDALVLVDAVSSMGAAPLATDAWGLDVVVTGSQKALMSPPGAAVLSIGARAWRAYEHARAPRFYWDWQQWQRWAAQGQTPVTPPLEVYYALDAALDLIFAEGLPNVYARHERLAKMTREGTHELGFELFPDPRFASPAVTALRPPPGMEASRVIRRARDEFGVELAGGQGDLKGKIVRIGHMGYVREADVRQVLDALAQVLKQLQPAAA
jgi:aspartate aminotransferase-like enzyme